MVCQNGVYFVNEIYKGFFKVACMLGATLTKEEVDEFMREADVVRDP